MVSRFARADSRSSQHKPAQLAPRKTTGEWSYQSSFKRSKLLKGLQYVPRVIITDKLKSYGAAKREILPGVERRQHKLLNNRADNSHQPTRLREKKMRKFKSAKHAQRFLSAFGPICGYFQPRRHRLNAREYRAILQDRFQQWHEVTGVKPAA